MGTSSAGGRLASANRRRRHASASRRRRHRRRRRRRRGCCWPIEAAFVAAACRRIVVDGERHQAAAFAAAAAVAKILSLFVWPHQRRRAHILTTAKLRPLAAHLLLLLILISRVFDRVGGFVEELRVVAEAAVNRAVVKIQVGVLRYAGLLVDAERRVRSDRSFFAGIESDALKMRICLRKLRAFLRTESLENVPFLFEKPKLPFGPKPEFCWFDI